MLSTIIVIVDHFGLVDFLGVVLPHGVVHYLGYLHYHGDLQHLDFVDHFVVFGWCSSPPEVVHHHSLILPRSDVHYLGDDNLDHRVGLDHVDLDHHVLTS